MVKLNKLVLSFLLSVFCVLPVPVSFASGRSIEVGPVSAARAKTFPFLSVSSDNLPVKPLQAYTRLSRLMPSMKRANKKPISAIPTVLDEGGKAETVRPVFGPENPLKASRLEFFGGTSLMSLGYTEFDSNGAWYDDERGLLPGFLLGGSLYWPNNWYASLQLDVYFGDVGYRGQTQSFEFPALSGLPINSRSDANIFDTTAIAGYRFSAVTLYGGLGYYFWRRNIRPTSLNNGLQVAGMLEFYSWSYALLGANVPMFRMMSSSVSLDLRTTYMLQADMEVNFLGYGGYDNASLNLGEDWGLRLALPWIFHSFGKGPSITIEPWYTRWNLNRSNAVELTVNGAYTGSQVHEPQSETRNFGISVYFRFLM